jgi:glutaredoxin
MSVLRIVAAQLLLCAAAHAVAGAYKIVGADGKVSYADSPPADERGAKVSEIKTYAGPPQIGTAAAKPDWTTILRRQAANAGSASAHLVMFSTPTCGYCRKAKQYMGASGIGYTEIDIQSDAAGRQEFARLGGRGVPFFVLGEKTMAGFSEASLDRLLGRTR